MLRSDVIIRNERRSLLKWLVVPLCPHIQKNYMSLVDQIKVSHKGVGFEEPPFWRNPWDSSWRITFGTQQKINRKIQVPLICLMMRMQTRIGIHSSFIGRNTACMDKKVVCFPIVANTQRRNSCDQQPCHSYFHIFHQTDSLSQRHWHHLCLTRNNNHWLISDKPLNHREGGTDVSSFPGKRKLWVFDPKTRKKKR